MLPILMEDGSSLDWRHGNYTSSVQIRRGGATVENNLAGAPGLAKLVEEKSASWALEVRCPRALFAATYSSQNPSFDVAWDPDDVHGPIYLTPGMVAVLPTVLSCSGLLDIWGQGAIRVPQGAWLVRGNMSRSENLAASLVVFRRKDDLQDGQNSRMSVQEDASKGEPRFIVFLPSKLHERAKSDRNIQVAGLIAACALLPNSPSFHEDSGSRVAKELRSRLRAQDIPLWDHADEWDPALAATVIEPFFVDTQLGEDDA